MTCPLCAGRSHTCPACHVSPDLDPKTRAQHLSVRAEAAAQAARAAPVGARAPLLREAALSRLAQVHALSSARLEPSASPPNRRWTTCASGSTTVSATPGRSCGPSTVPGPGGRAPPGGTRGGRKTSSGPDWRSSDCAGRSPN